MRTMLGDWWKAAGLPAVDRLSREQCEQVLAEVARLEWDGRPF